MFGGLRKSCTDTLNTERATKIATCSEVFSFVYLVPIWLLPRVPYLYAFVLHSFQFDRGYAPLDITVNYQIGFFGL